MWCLLLNIVDYVIFPKKLGTKRKSISESPERETIDVSIDTAVQTSSNTNKEIKDEDKATTTEDGDPVSKRRKQNEDEKEVASEKEQRTEENKAIPSFSTEDYEKYKTQVHFTHIVVMINYLQNNI